MAALPARNILDGTVTPTTSTMKTALGQLRDYLAGIIGALGTPADARAALGAPAATDIPNKNLVMNGDFKIAQRGTSQALSNALAYGSVDRWAFSQATSANGIASQVAAALTGFQFALKLGRNAGATQTGALVAQTVFKTEESIPLQGKPITLSFWAKVGANFSAASSNMAVTLYTGTGIDQSLASMSAWTGVATPINTTQALTNGWVRYSITITLANTVTQLGLSIGYTPLGTAGADDNLYITGIQLETGSTMTAFEYRKNELFLCQEYYYRRNLGGFQSHLAIGYAANTATSQVIMNFPRSMRVAPSAIETTGTPAHYNNNPSSGPVALTTVPAFVTSTPENITLNCTSAAATLIAGQGMAVIGANAASYIGVSADF